MRIIKYFILIAFVISSNVFAQQTASDEDMISLNVALPNNNNIPTEARQLLENRLKQIVTRHGIADNGENERFVITAKASVLSKDIMPSNPPRISQKIEVTFIIGDVIENKIYETASLEVSGIGQNETKAYVAAFDNIRPGNKIFGEMIGNAKTKIMLYYNTNCDKYLKKAQTLQAEQKFDEAIYNLMQIPSVSTSCYDKAQDLAIDIAAAKINFDAESLLNQAIAQWAGQKNYDNAAATLDILGQINVMANCQPQVQALINDINSKLRADEAARWAWKMQLYADAKEKEQRDFEFMVKRHDDGHTLKMTQVEAGRQIGVASAENRSMLSRSPVKSIKQNMKLGSQFAINNSGSLSERIVNTIGLW